MSGAQAGNKSAHKLQKTERRVNIHRLLKINSPLGSHLFLKGISHLPFNKARRKFSNSSKITLMARSILDLQYANGENSQCSSRILIKCPRHTNWQVIKLIK